MTNEEITTVLNSLFNNRPQRSIKMYTNESGLEKFNIAMENEAGFKRLIIGFKIPKFLEKKFRKNIKGKYYKLIR